MHRELFRRYRTYGADRDFRAATAFSFILFLGSLYINQLAIHYATEHAGVAVNDLILSNTPRLPVDNLFVYATFFVVAASMLICLAHPKRIPFALHAVTLFFVIRSIFTSLTHLGPFATHMADDFSTTLNQSFFGGDLFFSGHTGLPFLGALAFWHIRSLRYFYLVCSGSFAFIVLLGHIHYSIDVLSAFFITYGIYHIALWLFPRDRTLFMSEK